MSNPDTDDDKPLSPEQQTIVAKVRWLMLISGFATVLGIAVVLSLSPLPSLLQHHKRK